jgi:hypothetical protein
MTKEEELKHLKVVNNALRQLYALLAEGRDINRQAVINNLVAPSIKTLERLNVNQAE